MGMSALLENSGRKKLGGKRVKFEGLRDIGVNEFRDALVRTRIVALVRRLRMKHSTLNTLH